MPTSVATYGQVSSCKIEPVNDRWLQEKLTEVADFRRFHPLSEQWRRADCPLYIAQHLIARSEWRFPRLLAIVSTPILRADGTLLQIEGYDPQSELFLHFGETCFPQVSEQPTRPDCCAAFAVLRDLFSTFQLKPTDESVLISGLVTAINRRALPTAPMHVVTAHTAGSGKSLAVDMISIVASGRPCSVFSIGRTPEELEKRLGSALLQGESIVSLDNVDRPLESDFLCQVLTQQSVNVRPLGHSAVVDVPTSATFFATGNNSRLVGDLNRRAVVAGIDPKVERPETRFFPRDARAYALKHRARIVHAALTLLRGYIIAGSPGGSPPLGSFEQWSRLIRDAIVWIGGSDPCASQELLRAADPELEELRAVMLAWRENFADRKLKVADVIDTAKVAKSQDLHQALLAVAGKGNEVDARRLGRWLQKVSGRLVGGMTFNKAGEIQATGLWRLEEVEVVA